MRTLIPHHNLFTLPKYGTQLTHIWGDYIDDDIRQVEMRLIIPNRKGNKEAKAFFRTQNNSIIITRLEVDGINKVIPSELKYKNGSTPIMEDLEIIKILMEKLNKQPIKIKLIKVDKRDFGNVELYLKSDRHQYCFYCNDTRKDLGRGGADYATVDCFCYEVNEVEYECEIIAENLSMLSLRRQCKEEITNHEGEMSYC